MENNKNLEVFSNMPVPKAVMKNALPAMAAMLMVLVYNLADTFFIGQTHNALLVAAVSLATPVYLIFMSLGTLFGIGGTSVISRALGEGNKEKARKSCAFCFWGCVFVGILLAALILIFIDPILNLIGASADTYEYAKSYLSIIVFAGPFVLISNCYGNVVRTEGESGKAMLGLLLGNLVNVILDPIFILALGLDIKGAAIATVIGNIVGAGFYISYFLKGKSMLSIRLKDFTVKQGIAASVLAIGVPAALGDVLMSVSQIIINSQMSHYGDMSVAGMGVAMKVITITGMICMGLGQGVQPILGYCVGAKTWKRFKEVFKFTIIFALILGTVLAAICYVFTNQIVSAFLTDQTAFAYAVQFARILLSTSFLFGVFYVLVNALQAMGAATPALLISMSRQGIIFIPVLFILQAVIGMTGLVWAQPVADVLSILIAAILFGKTMKKMQML
nr:MATE family efflux transporter [uncultured Blautia sp.]